jgi:putative chitinase
MLPVPNPTQHQKTKNSMNLPAIKSLLPESIFNRLPEVIKRYEINTPKRLAHFISQCGHESGGFKVFTENLNYSAEGLLKTFPKYFNAETAAASARKPERIANRVYANRMSNGNEESGDGWKFRGRGCIQLTGRANYTAYDQAVPENVLENPDLVAGALALDSAGWFWKTNGLNKIADAGDVTAVTKRVNGGTHGLADRQSRYSALIALL